MKFTCEKALLVSAISVASRTVAPKSAIPSLEGLLIQAGVKVMLGAPSAFPPTLPSPARASCRRVCFLTSSGSCPTTR